uniref:Extender of the chronological lifespan protein 2 n=1 Tax=Anthurium amnicola TaxID=1678845 RepID=A0A1D1XKP5_9ARAE
MDLDWCLICERKTQGSLYCSEECRFKDYLSAYTCLTPSDSPTSSGSSTPTNSGSSTSNAPISANNSFAYLFYRKPSPCFQRPQINNTNTDHLKNNLAICDLFSEIKKSQSTLNPAFKNTIEMPKDSNENLARSLDTRHLHI